MTIAQDDVECGSLSYRTDVRWLDVRFPDGKGWTVCADTRLRPWDWILQSAGDHHPPIATGMTHQECRRVAVMTEAQAEAGTDHGAGTHRAEDGHAADRTERR